MHLKSGLPTGTKNGVFRYFEKNFIPSLNFEMERFI